ncbi:MAG: hypothetical protein M3285_11900 [Actinomycetota bacterium]|nr:hypothetical protein [Actinomycetota bacterium]
MELRKARRDGEVETIAFDRNVTVIVGSKNTSKTTTLRMIDYCLGNDDPATRALGPAVAESYASLTLDLEIAGRPYSVKRSLTSSEGYLTKVDVDDLDLSTRDFQRWIMEKLQWPELSIPKGRAYREASDVVPLTFRTLLRHIYRREMSWGDFALQEEEFHRRAVFAFFLGVGDARARAALSEYTLGETERLIASLEARRREVTEQGDALAERLGESMNIGVLSLDRLDALQRDLKIKLDDLDRSRQELLATLRASEGFAAEPSERYQDLQTRMQQFGNVVGSLRSTAAGYVETLDEIAAQTMRLERAETAVDVLGQLPVHRCPACGNEVSPSPMGPDCYLCGQATTADARSRRISLEISALARERTEVEEVLSETLAELHAVEEEFATAKEEAEALANQLDRERSDLIAPHLTELERMSVAIGTVQQHLALVDGLALLRDRVGQIDAELHEASQALDAQTADVNRLESERAVEEEHSSEFAGFMTEYLLNLGSEPWRFGPVTVAAADFMFYLGPQRWDTALGAESRVLFFLAYTNGLLRVPELGPRARPPGLAILDNPLQQGISDAVVAEALSQLTATARRLDAQLIITLPRDLAFDDRARRIRLSREFAP